MNHIYSQPPSAIPSAVNIHRPLDSRSPSPTSRGVIEIPAPPLSEITNRTRPTKSRGNISFARTVAEIFHASSKEEHDDHLSDPAKLPIKERLRHFTWTWFTMTMATGGIANVLYSVPDPLQFSGLYYIGLTVFFFNIILFLSCVTCITIRFVHFPSTFRASFLHPTESLFIPAAAISVGTILLNITQYGVGEQTGDWLERTMVILYWAYVCTAVLLSASIYLILWSTQTFTISQMTPIWIFPAYPLLIVGPHAGQLAKKVPPDEALQIIMGGYIVQGIGFMVSLMIYSAFLYRLMTHKLPKENVRPGMFVSVGPSGFTISGLINMGQTFPKVVNPDFMGEGLGDLVGKVGMIGSNFMGLWLWGLAFWFFIISVGAHFSSAAKGRIHFAMTWFSFVFPNTALTTATFAVSKALNSHAIRIIGAILAIGVIVTWLFVFFMMIRAIHLKQILWPQRQEDRNEGGWIEGDERLKSEDRRNETLFRRASAIRNTWKENDKFMKKRVKKPVQDIEEDRDQSQDRADYFIKEIEGRPERGRRTHLQV